MTAKLTCITISQRLAVSFRKVFQGFSPSGFWWGRITRAYTETSIACSLRPRGIEPRYSGFEPDTLPLELWTHNIERKRISHKRRITPLISSVLSALDRRYPFFRSSGMWLRLIELNYHFSGQSRARYRYTKPQYCKRIDFHRPC